MFQKLFLTTNRDLRQSYVYCEGGRIATNYRDGWQKWSGYQGLSALGGPEVFTQLRIRLIILIYILQKEVLTADPIEPGEYEIITTQYQGLIAHEAFDSWCRDEYV